MPPPTPPLPRIAADLGAQSDTWYDRLAYQPARSRLYRAVWISRQPLADLGVSPAEAEQSRRARKPRRPVSARQRRALAGFLRRAADRGLHRHRGRRRFEVLLPDRVAAVSPELLELADALERCADPDPAAVAELRRLLTDGAQSPLYNPDVHISELRATLYYLRAELSP